MYLCVLSSIWARQNHISVLLCGGAIGSDHLRMRRFSPRFLFTIVAVMLVMLNHWMHACATGFPALFCRTFFKLFFLLFVSFFFYFPHFFIFFSFFPFFLLTPVLLFLIFFFIQYFQQVTTHNSVQWSPLPRGFLRAW